MYRLALLGGASLTCDGAGVDGVTTRRRLLALLALLACRTTPEGGGGIPRDDLLVFLWPESRPGHARNSLNQALHALRSALGDEIVVGATSLRLNTALIACDRWEFDAHLTQGRYEAAVALRRGPLLAGLSIAGLTEFDEWVDAERRDVDRRYHEALVALARGAEARGDEGAMARRWWHALLREVPLSAVATLSLMRSLEAAGDLTSAIAEADAHVARARNADVPPHPEVLARAADYRARLVAGAEPTVLAAPVAVSAPMPSPDATTSAASGASAASAPVASTETVDRQGGRRRVLSGFRGRVTATIVTVAALGVIAAAGEMFVPRVQADARAVTRGAQQVVVLPALGRGTRSEDIAASFAPLLTTALAGAEGLQATSAPGVQGHAWIDEPAGAATVARRDGAPYALVSEIIVDDQGRVRAHARLLDARDGAVSGESTVQGTRDDLFALTDSTASALLQRWATARRAALFPDSRTLPLPLGAVKAYLRGEAALRADRYSAAIGAYREAIEVDSTFALAWYRLSVAAEWDGRSRMAADAAAQAQRHCAGLPEHERTLLAALAAWRRADLATAERLYHAAADQEPTDPEAWFGLAEVQFHAGPLSGRSVTLARPAFERALALDSSDAEAAVHLARIAAIEGRRRDADSLVRRARALTPDSAAVNLRAFRAFALGDRPGLMRVTRDILSGHDAVDEATALSVAVYLDDLAGAEQFARSLVRRERAADVRAFGYRLLAQAALARGKVATAERTLSLTALLDSVPALELRGVAASIPELGYPLDSVRVVRDAVRRWEGDDSPDDVVHSEAHAGLHRALRLHRLGLLAARLGERGEALALADRLARVPGDDRQRRLAATLGWSVRARVAAVSGDAAGALGALDRAEWPRGADVFAMEVADRFLRAQMLEALGRTAEAIGWYESLAQRATYELVYLAPAELRLAELYAARGDRPRARRHYDRFLSLWGDADPALQPIVRRARARRAALGEGPRGD